MKPQSLSNSLPQERLERRRGYRRQLAATALLRAVDAAADQPPIPAHVFELSQSGTGFSTKIPIALGSLWRFDLCEKRQSSRRAEVRSCRCRPDGMYDVGAQFC